MTADGLKDMVFTFTQKGLAQNMLAGANYDIWLHTYVDGKRVAAMDTAFIETEGYKGSRQAHAERRPLSRESCPQASR